MSELNYTAIYLCNKDPYFLLLLNQLVIYFLSTAMRYVAENYKMDLFYLSKENFKNLLFDSLIMGRSFNNLSYLSSWLLSQMEIPKNMLKRIVRHWIRPCLSKSIRGHVPIYFTVWKLMAPIKQYSQTCLKDTMKAYFCQCYMLF